MTECYSELDPGLISVQSCFKLDPFSQTERDRHAREGKGNDGPSSECNPEMDRNAQASWGRDRGDSDSDREHQTGIGR